MKTKQERKLLAILQAKRYLNYSDANKVYIDKKCGRRALQRLEREGFVKLINHKFIMCCDTEEITMAIQDN